MKLFILFMEPKQIGGGVTVMYEAGSGLLRLDTDEVGGDDVIFIPLKAVDELVRYRDAVLRLRNLRDPAPTA